MRGVILEARPAAFKFRTLRFLTKKHAVMLNGV